MTEKEKRTVSVSFRFTPQEKEMLDRLAQKYHLSQTALVCMLMAKEEQKNN